MKRSRTLLLLPFLLLYFSSCTNYGTRLAFKSDEIYYTKNVDESDAQKLGEYLQKAEYFQDKGFSVQLDKKDEKYLVRFATIENAENDSAKVDGFTLMGAYIATDLFPGKEVDVDLCDDHLKTKKTIPYAEIQKAMGSISNSSLGAKIDYPGGEIYYTSAVTQQQAQSLGNYLQQTGFFDPSGFVSVQLDKADTTYLFKMVAVEGAEDDQQNIQFAENYLVQISENVLDHAPVNFFFCDDRMQTKKMIPFPQ